MNCKPNDLAVIVRTGPRTTNCLGKIIRVTLLDCCEPVGWYYAGKRLVTNDGEIVDCCEDEFLRPIRDTDGADEVNAIAQRKSGREVKA